LLDVPPIGVTASEAAVVVAAIDNSDHTNGLLLLPYTMCQVVD